MFSIAHHLLLPKQDPDKYPSQIALLNVFACQRELGVIFDSLVSQGS